MRRTRTRLALIGALTLALGVTLGAGVAQGAKVKSTAAGAVLPDAVVSGTAQVQTAFTQEFKLKGSKVKNRQILDVNVTVNSTGAGPDANDDIDAVLVGPKGDSEVLNMPGDGQNIVNLTFDDKSELFLCNPFTFQRRDCNYLQGGDAAGTTGTVTGILNDFLNPVFVGGNPKGTWHLFVYDTDDGPPAITFGTTTLEVKTGKKFAKE